MLVPESKPENMNMTQKSWEALFWDIVANGISGWAQLLMDASLWLTALIQVRESVWWLCYVYYSPCGHLYVFSDGVFHIIDPLRVGADTASQQGERFDSLTLMRGRELESIWEKTVGIPTLCIWLIHKRNLGLGSRPRTDTL